MNIWVSNIEVSTQLFNPLFTSVVQVMTVTTGVTTTYQLPSRDLVLNIQSYFGPEFVYASAQALPSGFSLDVDQGILTFAPTQSAAQMIYGFMLTNVFSGASVNIALLHITVSLPQVASSSSPLFSTTRIAGCY